MTSKDAEIDFFTAAEFAKGLIEEFDSMGLNKGAALGGALTQILTHLIAISPDTPTAMGLLSSCISNAALRSAMPIITHHVNDEVH